MNLLDTCHAAVHQYMRDNYGDFPKYLLMNYKVYNDMKNAVMRYNCMPENDILTFRGVRLVPSDSIKVSEGVIACG
jgi:hypothetical protein